MYFSSNIVVHEILGRRLILYAMPKEEHICIKHNLERDSGYMRFCILSARSGQQTQKQRAFALFLG